MFAYKHLQWKIAPEINIFIIPHVSNVSIYILIVYFNSLLLFYYKYWFYKSIIRYSNPRDDRIVENWQLYEDNPSSYPYRMWLSGFTLDLFVFK